MAATLRDRMAERDARSFIGRRDELALFDTLLTDDPPANVLVLWGPGGVGKSTLLREMARRGSRAGRWVTEIDGRDLPPVPGALEAAFERVADHESPIVLVDEWDPIAVLGDELRGQVLPELPESTILVLAGRLPPEPAWRSGGWEQITVEHEVLPFSDEEAVELLAALGVTDVAG